ncbi:MAG TPA: hypothetical protein VFQ57_03995 [Sphingomonas sp.]|jgi:hypothetical protein|nr:hypothetical protein [Sphingomonas sp.]
MDELANAGRSLPAYALWPILLLSGLLVFALCRRTPSVAGRFIMVAINLRFALSGAHGLTFKHSPLGLSYNALATIAITGVGLLLIRRRRLFGAGLAPFYFYLGLLVTSGILSGEGPNTANAFVKYAYLIVLMFAVEDAIGDIGFDRFLKLLLPVFALPFVMQAASVVLGVVKAGENDGSASYIGGFNHEAAFSVTLSGGLLIVCLQRRIGLGAKVGMIAVCVVALFLANYRTVILAMMPLVGVAVLMDAPRHFVARQRAFVAGIMALLVVTVGVGGGIAGEERFADIGVAVTRGTDIIKRPELFSVEERRVMSGRPLIWSGYLYGWLDGTPKQKMLGHGPGSSSKHFVLYAHNTLVSALFEMGVLGVIATILLWLWMLGLAVLSKSGPKAEIIVAHVCFFILNMATMPMWMMEGMIFYGVLCGVTLHFFHKGRPAPLGRVRPLPRTVGTKFPRMTNRMQ